MAKDEAEGEEYAKELTRLQAKLCHLQEWVKQKGLRVIVVFEGRDAAGKGGTIRALTERVSPRVFRLVALPAPSDREKSQMYMQRYMQHFPAAGEIVIFDRSWYNRAGVEHVMGFCTDEQYERFSSSARDREIHRRRRHPPHQVLARGRQQGAGAPLRGAHRRSAPPVEAQPDGPASRAEVVRVFARARPMLKATDTQHAPWFILRSDDKKRARLNCIAHLLKLIPYKKLARAKVDLPKRSKKHAYDDEASLARRNSFPRSTERVRRERSSVLVVALSVWLRSGSWSPRNHPVAGDPAGAL